jgi:putative ABC transport system permease protein
MRKAIRALASRPGFTAVAVATLAIGFAVNAAIFSLTRTVLLTPLPYRDVERLVQIGEANPARGVSYAPAVPASYLAWRDRVSSLETTAAWRFVYFTLSGRSDAPLRVQGVLAAPSFFPLLGVTPALGRQFSPDEARPGRDRVVLLSHGFWRRQLGADPAVVGRALTVDGVPCTVIGVLPESFRFFRVLGRELDVWRPFVLDPDDREHSMTVYGRLRPGVTLEAARAELAAAYAALPAAAFRDGWTTDVARLSARFTANQRPVLRALEVAVALVMAIAAINIANLLLAVAAGRRKDLAVRIALGATRWRLATELGRETLLLAGAGAAVGVLLAAWIVNFLNGAVSYQDINRLQPFRVDGWVVAFTACLAGASAVGFALLPARRAADADVVGALKEASDSSTGGTAGLSHPRLRGGLVVAELALSIVLLVSALELTASALSLHSMDRGVEAGRVMTAQVSLNAPRYDDPTRLTQFADAVLARLTSSAGVEAASLVNYPPLSVVGTSFPIVIGERAEAPGREPRALCWVVAPRYFATVGIPILAGRDFTSADARDGPGVVIVSRRLAQRFPGGLAGTGVIGQRLTVLLPRSDAFWIPRGSRRPLTIVGVVGDVREDGIGDAGAGDPQLYLPYGQNPTRVLTLVARTAGPPHAAAPAMREAVRAGDPDQPTFDEKTLDEVRRETFARSREIAWLIGAFAALALVLSAVGVYGVMAYLTTARRREIGIRMALGASRGAVVRMVIADAMRLALSGVAIGLVTAPAAMAVARTWVVGLDRSHPAVLAAVAVLLTLVCAGAAAIPARRAANAAAVSFR